MSEELHIHGIEQHQIEHEAVKGVNLSQWVAILSAIFSCLAALISYQSTSKENEAILLKNEAIITTTQSADLWALYQAKKMKAHMMEVAMAASNDEKRISKFSQALKRYQDEAMPLQQQAQQLTQNAREVNLKANQLIKPHEKLAQAMTLLQIAISLASITALTRKRWLLGLSLASASLGALFAVSIWF